MKQQPYHSSAEDILDVLPGTLSMTELKRNYDEYGRVDPLAVLWGRSPIKSSSTMTMTVGHLRDIVNDLGTQSRTQSPLLDEIGERLATYNDHWRYVSTTVLRNNLCNLGLTLRLLYAYAALRPLLGIRRPWMGWPSHRHTSSFVAVFLYCCYLRSLCHCLQYHQILLTRYISLFCRVHTSLHKIRDSRLSLKAWTSESTPIPPEAGIWVFNRDE